MERSWPRPTGKRGLRAKLLIEYRRENSASETKDLYEPHQNLCEWCCKESRPFSRSERVFKMGSAGDSPAPVGDPPTGTAERNDAKRPCPLARTVAPVPSGESPDGTGGSPVLPENDFSNTLSISGHVNEFGCMHRTPNHSPFSPCFFSMPVRVIRRNDHNNFCDRSPPFLL